MTTKEIKEKILKEEDIIKAIELRSQLDIVDDEIEQHIRGLIDYEWSVGCYIRPNRK